MKRFSITTAILVLAVAMACDKSSETPARQGSSTSSGTTQPATSLTDLSKLPGTAANPPAGASQTVSGYATAPGMNPPHGQPNHRCDIPVGAPLNSPPGTQPSVSAQTSTPVTAAGMNPPHGQPNHRCDIPVGAPLSSPPGTTTTAAPTQPNAPAPSTTTAPGMNPPHGQPNHRCDIPVGAPLSSAPVNPK